MPTRISNREMTVKNMLKVRRSYTGFSLGETLIAVAILVIITAASLPAAVHVYRNAVDAANAQVLLSTTVNALRDELSTAWDVKKDSSDSKGIIYKSSDTGSQSKITVGQDPDVDSSQTIMLEEYIQPENSDWLGSDSIQNGKSRPLVSRELRRTTRDGNVFMTVTYKEASYEDGYVSFTGLQVERDGTAIAKMPAPGLLIRVMTAEVTDS